MPGDKNRKMMVCPPACWICNLALHWKSLRKLGFCDRKVVGLNPMLGKVAPWKSLLGCRLVLSWARTPSFAHLCVYVRLKNRGTRHVRKNIPVNLFTCLYKVSVLWAVAAKCYGQNSLERAGAERALLSIREVRYIRLLVALSWCHCRNSAGWCNHLLVNMCKGCTHLTPCISINRKWVPAVYTWVGPPAFRAFPRSTFFFPPCLALQMNPCVLPGWLGPHFGSGMSIPRVLEQPSQGLHAALPVIIFPGKVAGLSLWMKALFLGELVFCKPCGLESCTKGWRARKEMLLNSARRHIT